MDDFAQEPVRRTADIEDCTNLYVVHAIANRLTPGLARLGVHPNAVSIAGMAFGIAAGFAYFRYQDARYATLGFLLMIAWHVMDGVDGQLARLTRKQSATGRVLDGVCDYVTFAAVYLAFALQLGRQHGGLVWLIVMAAGLCHAIQSAAYEAQRQDYEVWGYGRVRDDTAPRRGGGVVRLYGRVQAIVARAGPDHVALDIILRSRPKLRRDYRETFAGPIRRWAILSANYRTLGIFICALLRAPLLYFLFEIIGFSVILAWLTAGQHKRHARFVSRNL